MRDSRPAGDRNDYVAQSKRCLFSRGRLDGNRRDYRNDGTCIFSVVLQPATINAVTAQRVNLLIGRVALFITRIVTVLLGKGNNTVSEFPHTKVFKYYNLSNFYFNYTRFNILSVIASSNNNISRLKLSGGLKTVSIPVLRRRGPHPAGTRGTICAGRRSCRRRIRGRRPQA